MAVVDGEKGVVSVLCGMGDAGTFLRLQWEQQVFVPHGSCWWGARVSVEPSQGLTDLGQAWVSSLNLKRKMTH